MISYKLAKQLKDAGFPHPEQERLDDSVIVEGVTTWTLTKTFGAAYYKRFVSDVDYIDDEIITIRLHPGIVYNPEYVYIPTLLELIEACGEVEFIIHCYHAKDEINPEPWYVIERPNEMDMERCSTPEEAIALLWLELNKK